MLLLGLVRKESGHNSFFLLQRRQEGESLQQLSKKEAFTFVQREINLYGFYLYGHGVRIVGEKIQNRTPYPYNVRIGLIYI